MDRELTAGALDPSEALTFRRTDAAARIPHHLSLWHLFQALLDDPGALQAFCDTDPVGGLAAPRRIRNDLELQVGVDTVWVVAPYVEVHASAAQGRACNAHLDRLLLRHLPHVSRAGDEDLVALDQVDEVPLEVVLEALDVIPDLLRYIRRQVGLDTPDTYVVEHHPRACDGLEDGLYALPLAEGVEDRGESPQLEHKEAYGRDVAGKPHELAHEDADVLGPWWYLHVEQVLDSEAVAVLVVHVGEVVEPVGHRDHCGIHAVLGDLLLAAVQVAHYRIAPDHRLPVELQDKPEEPVHGRMLRTHVHVYGLEPELVPDIWAYEAAARRLGEGALVFSSAFFSKHTLTSIPRRFAWCLSRSS